MIIMMRMILLSKSCVRRAERNVQKFENRRLKSRFGNEIERVRIDRKERNGQWRKRLMKHRWMSWKLRVRLLLLLSSLSSTPQRRVRRRDGIRNRERTNERTNAVESRSQMMRLKAQKLIGQLEATLRIELLKMPKKIRSMRFLQIVSDEFAGNDTEDVIIFGQLMRGIKRGRKSSRGSATNGETRPSSEEEVVENAATTFDRTAIKAHPLRTVRSSRTVGRNRPPRPPAQQQSKKQKKTSDISSSDATRPPLVSMTPRKNNSGPLTAPPSTRCVVRTVKKRGVPGVHIAVENIGDVSSIVDVDEKTKLSSEEKKDARQQIMDLQGQLAALMQQLQ